MKKIIFLFGFILFATTISYSQSGWQWVNPYPTGQRITSMSFINANTGMAVTDYGGTILWTTNGGNNLISYRPFNNSYFSCLLLNENTGFAGEVSGYTPARILRTTNKGKDWEVVFNTGLYIGIHSIVKCGNIIYACGGNIYMKSTDNGINWIMNTLEIYTTDIRSIKFINEYTGFVCGTANVVAKTTNGGINWFSIFLDSMYYNFQSVLFKNENTGFVISSERGSVRTTNSGVNWTLYLNQLGGTGDCYGENIVMKDYYSTNFGLTWMFSSNEGYYQNFADSNTCYSCYNDYQTIWKSTNKGVNWSKISKNILENSRDLKICNKNIMYILSPNKIFKTFDSGENFSQKFENNQYYLNAMDFEDSLKGVVVGSNARVLTTTNGGNNWVSYTIGSNSFIDVSVINNKIVMLDSATTTVYVSTNFGNNWNSIYISSDCGRVLKFINYNVGFILNYGSKLYKTTNGGFNWNFVSNLSASNFDFLNENIGIGVANNKYRRTTNGGITWDTINFPVNIYQTCIKFAGTNTVYTAGLSGRILKSTDLGLSWVEQEAYSYIDNMIMHIDFLDSLYGFVLGGRNLLRTYTGGEINVRINEINTIVPDKYYLSQNCPNPFNPTTKIRFELPLGKGGLKGIVSLKVYNILGKQIATLVNEQIQPGTYEVTFDGSNLPSGVYFYQLRTGNYIETKKLVLLK